jgi:hypothetical protein
MTTKSNLFSEPQGGMIGVVSIHDVKGLTANARMFTDRAPEISVKLNGRCSISYLCDLIDELVEFRNTVRQLSVPTSKEDLTL